jgi:hypothetical protein
MVLAVAHLFGFYNPKQLADFLDIPHQQLYAYLIVSSIDSESFFDVIGAGIVDDVKKLSKVRICLASS